MGRIEVLENQIAEIEQMIEEAKINGAFEGDLLDLQKELDEKEDELYALIPAGGIDADPWDYDY